MHKLFMILLGCRPKDRNTEQHDIFFGIATSIAELKPAMQKFWPGTLLHIDAWRVITNVDGIKITVEEKPFYNKNLQQLFFLNLGGYKQHEFEEFHYKLLSVAPDKIAAIKAAKQTAFFKHTTLPGTGTAHIDDKYGVDVDEIFQIEEILPAEMKSKFSIYIDEKQDHSLPVDQLHLGYLKWSAI